MTQWTVVAMLTLAVGGHWVFLQTAAWVGMALTYSQSDSILTALKKTFDGEHPCRLCKVVESGKKAEKDQPMIHASLKLEMISFAGKLAVFHQVLEAIPVFAVFWAGLDRAPPLRPPPLLQ